MICNIEGCDEETSFNYDWEQGTDGPIRELWLCKYCEAQLLGEMLKQMAIERMLIDR